MRHENWPEILAGRIKHWQTVPFQWGSTDCVSYVIDVVQALTGTTFVNRSAGLYDTEFGALRAVKNFGGSLEELVTLRLGAPIAAAFAQRGDVLMHENNLGICLGAEGAFRTPEGLVSIPVIECARAWRVE